MSNITKIIRVGAAAVIGSGVLAGMAAIPASAQGWYNNNGGYYHRYDHGRVYHHRYYRQGPGWVYRTNRYDYRDHPYAGGWRWNPHTHVWFQIVL